MIPSGKTFKEKREDAVKLLWLKSTINSDREREGKENGEGKERKKEKNVKKQRGERRRISGTRGA